MTICLATTHFAPVQGGIANYYNCLAKLLTDAGHRVIVLTVSADPVNKEEEIISEGLLTKVTLYTGYRNYVNYYSQYFRPGSYAADHWIATGMAMRDWLIKNTSLYKIDLVETMDFGGTGNFLKQPGLPPLVIDAHSCAIQIDRNYQMKPDDHLAVIKELEAFSFKQADAIIAHSPMNLEELRTLTQRTVLFCRAPWLLPVHLPEQRKPAKNRHLVISSLQQVKGAELMIQAAAIAGNSIKDICIYWAGDDSYSAPGGQLTSAYLEEKYPETWGRQFVWLKQKNREEINRLLCETEAVIIPSLWDTFNYVVPETVYQEIPLIVSDKTGAAYLVKDHPSVTIFPAADADALATLLIHFDTAGKTRPPGISTEYDLKDYFSPDKILNERMPVYKELLKKKDIPFITGEKDLTRILDRYTTPWRKYYYFLRKKIKFLLRPDTIKLKHN